MAALTLRPSQWVVRPAVRPPCCRVRPRRRASTSCRDDVLCRSQCWAKPAVPSSVRWHRQLRLLLNDLTVAEHGAELGSKVLCLRPGGRWTVDTLDHEDCYWFLCGWWNWCSCLRHRVGRCLPVGGKTFLFLEKTFFRGKNRVAK